MNLLELARDHRRALRRDISARAWSNDVLREYAETVVGVESVLNVSGWEDKDKEGDYYRSYFDKSVRYHISNYPKDNERGITAHTDIPLDIEAPLAAALERSYDLVFSHTVLEHVRLPERAFSNMCTIADAYLLTVVPFVQGFHYSPGNFGDYYRFSPMLIRELHMDNGFRVIREAIGPRLGHDRYVVSLAARRGLSIEQAVTPLEELNETAGHQSISTTARTLARLGYLRATSSTSRSVRGLADRFMNLR